MTLAQVAAFPQRACFHPVLVHEEDGLRAALLAAARIRILVGLPRHIVHVAHIWPQQLPVEAGILQEYLRTRF